MRDYSPRGMPARFMVGAPEIVRRAIVDILAIRPAAPLDFDVVLRELDSDGGMVGVDFGADGARGCHFFLKAHEMRTYRERNRRKRTAWQDLPLRTQQAIVAYLESED